MNENPKICLPGQRIMPENSHSSKIIWSYSSDTFGRFMMGSVRTSCVCEGSTCLATQQASPPLETWCRYWQIICQLNELTANPWSCFLLNRRSHTCF